MSIFVTLDLSQLIFNEARLRKKKKKERNQSFTVKFFISNNLVWISVRTPTHIKP